VNDFAVGVNELHSLECLVKRRRIHFASFQANDAAKFLPGYQIGSGNAILGALYALGHSNQTEAFPAKLPSANGIAEIFKRPRR